MSFSINNIPVTYSQHGLGYLVSPNSNFIPNEDIMTNFYGGKWNEFLHGWIFSIMKFESLHRDEILKPILPKCQSTHIKRAKKEFVNKVDNDVKQYLDKPLEGFKVDTYGNGFVLYHENLLEFPEDYKYFHGAWWMDKHNLWFFKEDKLQSILNKGAVIVDTCDYLEDYDEDEDMDGDFTGHYEQDLSEGDDEVDEEVEHDELQDLYDDINDPDYVPSESESDMESEDESEDDNVVVSKDLFDSVTYQKYGKGWLVKPNRDFEFYGKKYLNGGFWFPKQKGWFFKDADFQKLSL